jgi:hypothetical protein
LDALHAQDELLQQQLKSQQQKLNALPSPEPDADQPSPQMNNKVIVGNSSAPTYTTSTTQQQSNPTVQSNDPTSKPASSGTNIGNNANMDDDSYQFYLQQWQQQQPSGLNSHDTSRLTPKMDIANQQLLQLQGTSTTAPPTSLDPYKCRDANILNNLDINDWLEGEIATHGLQKG